MNSDRLLQFLKAIREGTLSPEEGMKRLADFPYEDAGFAKIDHQRALRTGIPEVIYGAGKTDEQIVEIFERMARQGGNVLATRVTPSAASAVGARLPEARYHAVAEEGVPLKEIATAIGRGLNVAVISIAQEQAQGHFGFLGFFAGRDPLTSSAQTRAKLGWNPTGPSLLTDLGNMRYSEV